MRRTNSRYWPVSIAALLSLGGCSIQQLAIRSVGEMLSSGTSVYEADDDPALIGEALPFSLKLIDSLLAEQPENRNLLLAGARGYLLYGYAFVGIPADEARFDDFERALELRQRARNLYLRAYAYASRALELDYPGLVAALREQPEEAVIRVAQPQRDVPALYWTAASLGLAISSSRNDPALLARLPEVDAMLQRALALDEDWSDGALHEFAISLAGARPVAADRAVLDSHYQRAAELAAGSRAGVYLTFAETAAIPKQDRKQFSELLARVLAVDVDEHPEHRLLNIVAQKHAHWLLDHADELFLE
jgi:predicted anti-sigma-YlaC factor YlaD